MRQEMNFFQESNYSVVQAEGESSVTPAKAGAQKYAGLLKRFLFGRLP